MDDFPIYEKKDSQDYLSYTSLEHEGTYDDDLFDFLHFILKKFDFNLFSQDSLAIP